MARSLHELVKIEARELMRANPPNEFDTRFRSADPHWFFAYRRVVHAHDSLRLVGRLDAETLARIADVLQAEYTRKRRR